uniref:Small nuclear ribonucleoprotein Sm D1 n=1 Tax=Setaria digitata TaxID=48799 RepID=A0A915PMP1_9BILA
MRLQDKFITIELKNGTVISGFVKGVDIAMNFHLSGVSMTLKNEKPVPLAAISIRGNNVRYIIFPDSMNLDALMIEVPQPMKKIHKTPKQTMATLGQRSKTRGAERGRGSIKRGPNKRGFWRGSAVRGGPVVHAGSAFRGGGAVRGGGAGGVRGADSARGVRSGSCARPDPGAF